MVGSGISPCRAAIDSSGPCAVATSSGVVLVEAPAGFGRTTLLQQAVEQGPARRRDRDHLVVATSTGELSVADTVADAVRDTGEDGDQVAVLVDDAHLAADADTLAELVEALPPAVHLVLSCRLGRLPGAARLVARADAIRLSGRDLPSPGEKVAGAGHEQPTDPELAAWPAVAALVTAGADDLVVAYLQAEVLGDLDERDRPGPERARPRSAGAAPPWWPHWSRRPAATR